VFAKVLPVLPIRSTVVRKEPDGHPDPRWAKRADEPGSVEGYEARDDSQEPCAPNGLSLSAP